MISYILYRIASVLVRILPAAVARTVATGVALVFYTARPAIRRNVRRNYEKLGIPARSTFPVFRNFSRAVADFLALPSMKPDGLRALCTLRGAENLDRALASGAGAILFSAHLGPWELAGAYLSSIGYRLHTAALEHPSARVTSFFSARRKKWGLIDYPARAFAAGLVRALEKGESVVLLIDRNFSNRGMRLRFLGETVLLPDGHVLLSRKTGAALVPCCCFYTPSGGVDLTIGEPLDDAREGASDEEIAARCLAEIETFVRAHPEQWFTFDHLWQEAADA